MCYQATVVHGNTSTKDSCISVKQHDSTGLHLSVEKSDPAPYITDERIGAREYDWETESSDGTRVLCGTLRSVVAK